MNRGVDRQIIFHRDSDRRAFLDLFAESAASCGVEVHAYCLMDNHFHLLVHCPDGGLSAMVQQFASKYTRLFNWRSSRDGPLCRSRFRSRHVRSVEYIANVGRYIHRNPLDRADTPTPAHLRRFKWSSYARYLDLRAGPSWCHVEPVRDLIGSATDYAQFVEGASSEPTDLDWAVEVEAFSVGLRGAHVGSSVRALILDRLGMHLDHPYSSRSARYRARTRAEQLPVLDQIAERVVRQLDARQRQALAAGPHNAVSSPIQRPA